MSLAGFQISDIFTWQVAAWVLVILVAGFIGQFGKSFAQYVIGLFKRKKTQGNTPPASSVAPEESFPEPVFGKPPVSNEAKKRKKETKALLKAKKKKAKQGKTET